ncbi:MAG: bifunctional 4-hydroxy-2-oxoglutarate aldolase/2-dehydro-3-deoxy-phosphogluconate aldolase [Rhodoglobus sp.]
MTAATSNEWFDREFAASPVMIIMRGLGVERSLELSALAWDIGVATVELPIQNPEDLEALKAVVALGAERGRTVGAGTVLNAKHVAQAAEAGATYTVSPGLDSDVIKESLDAGLPTLPGVATASEVQAGMRLGLTWFKAFPAAALGPGWISAMHGPFPGAKFVATGGVNVTTAPSFLTAGARVVSLGSALNDESLPALKALVG